MTDEAKLTTDTYYGPYAYNSTQPRKIDKQLITPDKLPHTAKRLRKERLYPVALDELCFLRVTNCYYFTKPKIQHEIEKGYSKNEALFNLKMKHQVIAFPNILANPTSAVDFLTTLLRVAWYGGILIFILFLFVSIGELLQHWQALLKIGFFLTIAPYFAMKLSQLLHKIVPDHKYQYLIFNRQTGMITVPGKSKYKNSLDIPFDEFDTYIDTTIQPNATSSKSLWYCHRYSPVAVNGSGISFEEEMMVWAAYYHWFMDISKPLPDVPEYEPFRHLDPVTAAYDKKINRDPHYWQKKTAAETKALLDQAYKRTKEILEAHKDSVSFSYTYRPEEM